MKAYWDTSAFLQAALTGLDIKGVTRTHTLAESFSNLTGRGVTLQDGSKVALSADDAADLLEQAAADLDFLELTPHNVLQSMAAAQKKGVRGGGVYDFLHAVAAEKSGADVLYTLNAEDFKGLSKVPLEELPA